MGGNNRKEATMRARDAIRKLPETIQADETIARAANRMDEAAVGALVVIDEGRPVGIVTDRDLVVRAQARGYPQDSRVDSVMTTGLVGIDADDDVRQAIQLFSHHAIRRLPVVEGDQIRGMITLDDVVIDLAHDLEEATKPLAAQVLFGHPA
jgi:CBS domain-containing protein